MKHEHAKGSRPPHALVVAYAFAPAAPIGTMRTLRLVRRLDAEGWRVTVLSASPGTYPATMPMDRDLLGRVPPRVEIVHAPVLRPMDRLSGLLRSRSKNPAGGARPTENAAVPHGRNRGLRHFFKDVTSIPDGEIGWLPTAVWKGALAIRRHRPDVIYSSAPPWTGQLVAYALARLSRLPWAADFRDPWARAPWREDRSERATKAATALERTVVDRADAVFFATAANREEYARHYGASFGNRFHVVRNGCDPDEFRNLKRPVGDGRLVLVHGGSLYGARTPEPLFRAIASLVQRGALDSRFCLRLVGETSRETELKALGAQLGIQDYIEFVPRVPRAQMLHEMAAAAALLVLQPTTTVSIPGKLYEYLCVAKPILALCAEGETADLVRRSGIGFAVTTDDIAAIEAGLMATLRLAAAPVPQPPTELFDGNWSAGEAVAVMRGLVERARERGPSRHQQQIAMPTGIRTEEQEWKA